MPILDLETDQQFILGPRGAVVHQADGLFVIWPGEVEAPFGPPEDVLRIVGARNGSVVVASGSDGRVARLASAASIPYPDQP